MRDQLIQYVNLLFAGAPDSGEIRAEILQNTLDRYDDLIGQGKSPEAAYRLAISGIGDINEILGTEHVPAPVYSDFQPETPEDSKNRKLAHAVATALYITCPLPLFIIQDEIGLCLLLVMVAAATALNIIYGKKKSKEERSYDEDTSPKQQLKKSVKSIIWAIGLAVYFILSFATHAWYITWLVFPIMACVKGLVVACMDLKEANDYEN